MKTPAVVLGLSGTGLSVVRQLGRAGVPVTGVVWREPRIGEIGSYSRYCRVAVAPDPASEPEAFAKALLELPVADGAALIAAADDAVVFTQAYGDRLAGRYRFYRLPPETAAALVDKRAQYRLAETAGVPLPRTFYPSSVEEAAEAASQLRYPAFVKGHFGHLWRKHFQNKGIEVRSPAELASVFAQVRGAGVQSLVQEVILGPPSDLVSVCCHRGLDGRMLGMFTQRKVRQFPVDFGVGSFVESARHPELEAIVREFLDRIGYLGTAEVEFKRDSRDGRFKFIELNPRVWQQHALSVACGVDFARLQYEELSGGAPAPMEQRRFGPHWISVWDDLAAAKTLVGQGTLRWGDWFRSLRNVAAHNAWAADDPGPALRLYAFYFRAFLRSRWRKLGWKGQNAETRPSS